MKSLPATLDLRYSSFYLNSVMMYSFADWMFVNGAHSSCYTKENMTLSAQDLKTVLSTRIHLVHPRRHCHSRTRQRHTSCFFKRNCLQK